MHSLWKPLCQGEKNRNSVLCDNRPVDIAGVGDNYIAADELGIHQLVDGGGGRVDPAQLFSGNVLFRTKRPAYENVSIGNFAGHAVVVFELEELEIRKGGLKPVAQP